MKTNSFLILLLILALPVFIQAQDKVVTANIKVYGNCGMCKSRIEKALDHKGIKKATWNTKSKMLEVIYVPSKITESKIHELVASVGHDTDKAKAKDTVYGKLPYCCLYRDHDHSVITDN
jgi:predicted transcriptional regulator